MQTAANSAFGKLGNRSYARLRLNIPAELVLTHGSRSCLLDNLSRSGARLRVESPPRIGSVAILKFDTFDAFAAVVWVHGIQCGLLFDNRLTEQAMQDLRWISDNRDTYQRAQMQGAARNWAMGES